MAVEHADPRDRHGARFLVELEPRVGSISAIITALQAVAREPATDDPQTAAAVRAAIDKLHRHGHSISGTADSLGFTTISSAARLLCDLVPRLAEAEVFYNPAAWVLLAEIADGLKACISAYRDGHEGVSQSIVATVARLRDSYAGQFEQARDAVREFEEIAKLLQLSDEDQAAFRFPTAQAAQSSELYTPPAPVGRDEQAAPAEASEALTGIVDVAPDELDRQMAEDLAAIEDSSDLAVPTDRVVVTLCTSALRMLEQAIVPLETLEADLASVAAMRAARRVFHTIKGDCGQVGFDAIAELAEAAEDVFDAIFEARERNPGQSVALPAASLPILQRAREALTTIFRDPARLAELADPELSLVQQLRALGAPELYEQPPEQTSEDEARRRRLLPSFLAEGRVLLDALHGHLRALEDDPTDSRALLRLLRVLHTLKGNAAGMSVSAVEALAGAGESLLESLAESASAATEPQLSALGDMEGGLRGVMDAVDRGGSVDDSALQQLIEALQAPELGTETPRHASSMAPIPFAVRNAQSVPARRVTPWDEPTQDPQPIQEARTAILPETPKESGQALAATIASVDLVELNRAVDLFGRQQIARTIIVRRITDLQRFASEGMRNSQRLQSISNRLVGEFEAVRRERRASEKHANWDPLEFETFDSHAQVLLEVAEIIADQEEIAGALRTELQQTMVLCEDDQQTGNQLQQSLLSFRLIQFGSIEPRLDQLISSTARTLGKEVRWELRGASVAVDKAILDALQEPLLHLLRNAIDHGLEDGDERTRLGKAPVGTIIVEAIYDVNGIELQIRDDGRGISPDLVVAAAVRRGLLSAQEAAELDATAQLDLIWRPAVSTAGTVTSISGRGVGLDIVHAAVDRLRGRITVTSCVGQGTTFTMALPVSLSIVRTLLVRDGDSTVAVPIAQVEDVHIVRRHDIVRAAGGPVARIGDRSLPFIEHGLAQATTLQERLAGERIVVLEVRREGGTAVGFAVDEVVGEEDTLVKPLPSYLARHASFIGCSVDGDGSPRAIVDLHHLAAKAGAGTAQLPRTVQSPRTEWPLVLIVDDSLFMRRTLAELFAEGGFRVATAEDGEAGLAAIAQRGMPDLIALDMEMPRMNGLEMLSILRQMSGGREVPVFMITTRGQERHRQAALAAGVTRYFGKPFHGDEVLDAARALCRATVSSSA